NGRANKFQISDDQRDPEFDKVVSFFEDRSGVIWIGTSRGLRKIHKYRKEFGHIDLNEDQHGAGGEVKGIVRDDNGRVFIATHGLGIVTYGSGFLTAGVDGRRFRTLGMGGEDAGARFINAVGVDARGYLWAGSDGHGVYRFKTDAGSNYVPSAYKHYDASRAGHRL